MLNWKERVQTIYTKWHLCNLHNKLTMQKFVENDSGHINYDNTTQMKNNKVSFTTSISFIFIISFMY